MAEKVAENEGAGNFSSAGVGLGMISGVAGGMDGVVAGVTSDALSNISAAPSDVKNSSQNPNASFKQKIEKLMMMKDV